MAWEAWRVRRSAVNDAGLAPTAALCVACMLLPATSWAATTSREVADALTTDPVYVAPAQASRFTVPERGRVRVRIAREDAGRIQIVLISPESARRAGGVDAFANAVDQAMDRRRGSLVVTTGSAFHVITSHRVVNPTAAALRSAVESNEGKRLVVQLLAAVDGIAAVDPGPGADLNAPAPSSGPPAADEGGEFLGDVSDSVRLALLIVAGAIALPFLLFALFYVLRWRRRRAAAQDREELAVGDTREALAAMAQEISDLDLDTEMPGASARGREDYTRAIELYDRANRLLTGQVSDAELEEAGRAIAQGRAHLATAREELATKPS
jgi:hypothetical protein